MKNSIFLTVIFAITFANAVSAQDHEYKSPPGVYWNYGRAEPQGLRITCPPAQFEHNLDVTRLEDFVGDIQRAVGQGVSNADDVSELVVKVTLSKQGDPHYEISSSDEASERMLRTLYERLQAVPGMRCKVDSLPFELRFKFKPKT